MTLKRLLGLDTRADRYSYGVDPVAGYVSGAEGAGQVGATTCGYCSVGCGMFIGVKDGRAVSVRGNPDHPVNRGMLCPKGCRSTTRSPRTTARATRCCKRTAIRRVSWDDALTTMATRFRDVQARYGPGSVGVISTGQLVTEEFYALGKLVQLGIGTATTTATPRCACPRRSRATSARSAATGPPGAYEDLERADVILLIGANIAENHPILCWRLRSNPRRRSSSSIRA